MLFLDELPEFNRRSLEVLPQPLEAGCVTISRALHSTTFPARFVLVAAMTPRPCGYLGDAKHPCKCTPMQVERYMARVSGPLLDRIDLHLEVPAVPFQGLSAQADGTPSAVMREQVGRARRVQQQRFGPEGHVLNSRFGSPARRVASRVPLVAATGMATFPCRASERCPVREEALPGRADPDTSASC